MNYTKLYKVTAIIISLAAVQSAQAVLPKDDFPDKLDGMNMKGTFARKGTIGATFYNVVALDKLFKDNGDSAEIEQLIKDQHPLGRSLYVLDVFRFQPIDVWLSDATRQGRILVAVLSLQTSTELISDSIRSRLQTLSPTLHPILQREIGKL
jgi:hypothetical protein